MSRRDVLKLGVAGAAALSLPNLLEACATSTSQSNAANKEIETLNWGLNSTVRSLDQAHSFDNNSGIVQNLGMENLVTYTNDLKIAPLLAESWTAPDNLHYVFKIRQGVKFWDGTPLTSDDVAFSLGRQIDPKVGSQVGSYFTTMKSIEATGPLEVTVELNNPDPLLPYEAIFGQITSRAFASQQGDKFGAAAGSTLTIMGTGPYKFTSYVADQGVTLIRNEDYWGTKPLIKNINVKFITDAQTLQLAYRSGEIDGVFAVPLSQTDQWAQIPESQLLFAPGMITWVLCFDVTKPPFTDLHVRRAFAYACDRAGIVKALLHGHGSPAKSTVPPEQWSNLLPGDRISALYASLDDYPFDINKAKQELAQSSVPNGFSVAIPVPNTVLYYQQALLTLSENLKQIGVNLEVQSVTYDAWLSHIYAHDIPLQLAGYFPDYPDPADYLVISYPSADAVPNQFNMANYKNPSVDALLVDQAIASPDKRATDLEQVMKISNQDLPYYAMWWEDTSMAIRKTFRYTGFNGIYYNQMWARNIKAAD